METRDLEYVLAVEAHGGIGRAAEALDMTQPALTKAVQRVEAQLGVPLFERTTLGMRVTQAGAVFLERARRIGWNMKTRSRKCAASRPANKGCCASAIPRRCPMRWCWARAGN